MRRVDPRRAARLHRPRPDRADRRPLGPQLRQAPREGRPAGDAEPPEHLLRDAQPVPHAAAAVPRPLRPTSRSSSSSRSDLRDDRAKTLRSVFEFVGVDPDFTAPEVRAGAPPTSSRKKRATRLAAGLERASRSRGGRMLPTKVWLALDERLPLRSRSSARTCARRSARRCCGRCVRTPSDCESLIGRPFRRWSIWE